MSRPNITDEVINGLDFARACVLDQRASSHGRKDHSWDDRYAAALGAIDFIVGAHELAAKKAEKVAKEDDEGEASTMSTRYRELIAGHEVEHDWPTMQRPIVKLSRPGTRNDDAYLTPDEARRLAKALEEAAEVAES